MSPKRMFLFFSFLSAVLGCESSPTDLHQSFAASKAVDTRTLTEVAIVPRLRDGDSFIWGYYPGGGTKARTYEGYVKLPDRQGRPTLAMLTLFPDEAPAGKWVLHDGIGFDYDEVVTAFAEPTSRRRPREQMFGWDADRQEWFASTNQPNTSANTEKFNYRRAVNRSPHLAWATQFACYDGQDVAPVSSATGACEKGEPVFQQIPGDNPSYVFPSFYSLSSGITLYKLFNEGSNDPDARVAMRLVYAHDRDGERRVGDRRLSFSILNAFKATIRDILARAQQ